MVFAAALVLPEAFLGLSTPLFPGKTKLLPAAICIGFPLIEAAFGLNNHDYGLVAIGDFGLLAYTSGLLFSSRPN